MTEKSSEVEKFRVEKQPFNLATSQPFNGGEAEDAAGELVSLARRLRQWQEDRRLSTAAMIRRFGQLGSDKTFNKLVRGDLDEVDVESQLVKYRAAWALVEAVADATGAGDPLYDDLSPALLLRNAFTDILAETGNGRFILLQGDTGSGKTSAAKALCQRYGTRLAFVELSPVVGDSPYNFLLLLLRALGVTDAPKNAVDCLAKVVEILSLRRRCIIIDELHHAGPRILNTIKSLLNTTPGEFIGLCMPTLWWRMEKSAYEECRQLVGNRLAERIRLERLNRSDLTKLLTRGVKAGIDDIKRGVDILLQAAGGRGNLAFARDVVRRLAAGGERVSLEDFVAAVKAEQESR
jgi:hypothetical protein